MWTVRKDQVTSGKIEIALIFQQMLSTQDASNYLREENISEAHIDRIMHGGERRRYHAMTNSELATWFPPSSTQLSESFYSNNGRRKNVICAAIVQAALSLVVPLGASRVEAMLKREDLPDDVITRVLGGDVSVLRSRLTAKPIALANLHLEK